MARVVLDASILIAVASPTDAHHAAAIRALDVRRDEQLILPASAYTETMVWPMSQGSEPVARLDAFLEEMGIQVAAITRDVGRRAAELRAGRRSLRLGDALVIATGDLLDADEIVTSDRRWRRSSDRVVLV